MIVIIVSALVAVVGLVIFLGAKTNPEAKEIGRIMFAFGLLAALLEFGHAVVSLPK